MYSPMRITNVYSEVVIPSNYIFNDAASRDSYFASNAVELSNGLKVFTIGDGTVQQYSTITSSWGGDPTVSRFTVDLIQG